MSAADKDKIDCFITTVEKLLGTTFTKHFEKSTITLHAPELDLSVIIYLPGAGGRLPNAPNRTIHIDYDQIVSDAGKLSARLASLYGKGQVVYARKTVVARIDKRVSIHFLQEHHLQMAIPGKYRYGLFQDGELLSVAIFSGGRRMRDQHDGYRSFELIRFCHKSNFRVVGGLSKLLTSFIKDFQPNDIMTYVDRDWSQDSNLATLGFKEVGKIPPQCYLIVHGLRQNSSTTAPADILPQDVNESYSVCNSGSTKLVLQL